MSTTDILTPSKALLTSSTLTGANLSVVPQAPNSVNVVELIRDIVSDKTSVRPLPNSSTAHTAISAAVKLTIIDKLIQLLQQSTYGEDNVVTTVVSLLQSKKDNAATSDTEVQFTRGDVAQLSAAYMWLVSQTERINQAVATANSATKEITADIQSVPSNETLENTFKMLENKTALETKIGEGTGLDTTFLTKYGALVDEVPTTDVTEDVTTTVSTAPEVIGSVGDNLSPVVFEGMSLLQDSESKNAAMQIADKAYWDSLTDEVQEFVSPSLYLEPVKDKVEVIAELLSDDYLLTDVVGWIGVAPTSGGTAVQTNVKVSQITSVPSADVLAMVGNSALVDLDFALKASTLSVSSRRSTETDEEYTARQTRVMTSTSQLTRASDGSVIADWTEMLALTRNSAYRSEDFSDIVWTSIVRRGHNRSYTTERAIFNSNLIGKLWQAIKNVKLSDVRKVTNVLATGAAITGSLTGIQGLTDASTALSVIDKGLGQIQKSSALVKTSINMNDVTASQVYDTVTAGTLFNALPTLFDKGRQYEQAKTADTGAMTISNVDRMAKNSLLTKRAILNTITTTASLSSRRVSSRLNIRR